MKRRIPKSMRTSGESLQGHKLPVRRSSSNVMPERVRIDRRPRHREAAHLKKRVDSQGSTSNFCGEISRIRLLRRMLLLFFR